ncbi:MAG: hypothetical protein Kow00120_30020 [Anaerolineae bacterium]
MRPDRSPDQSPDLLPAPIAYGAFFAASARGDAASPGGRVIELCAYTGAHLTAEGPISFFSHRAFLAALRARFPGARIEVLEPTDDARRAWVFVDDPASAITPDETDLWDALYGDTGFAAGWDAACAAARATASATRDHAARLEAALRALVSAAQPVIDWFTTGARLDVGDVAELNRASVAATAALDGGAQ